MSAPKPEIIERLAEMSQANLHKAVFDYGYLFPSAYSRSRRGGGERVANSDEPNLSDLMVGSVAAIRRDIESAAIELYKAFQCVEIAQARLNDAASRMDSRAVIEPEQHERAVSHPADRGDVERAKKAQTRRAGRALNRRLPWSREEVSG